MPLRELVAVALTLLVTLPLVPLALLARSRPHLQGALRASVPLVAIFIASRAFFGAVFDYRVAIVATSGESVDVLQRESILRESLADSRPLVVLGAAVVVMAFAWAIAVFETRRARMTLIAGGLALVGPLAWIGTLDVSLHDRLARKELANVPSGTSFDACDALAAAVEYAGDLALTERTIPDVRARAHACIAHGLDALDTDSADGARLRFRASLWMQVHPGKGQRTALDFLAESPLAIDPEQRANIARRQAQAHGSAS